MAGIPIVHRGAHDVRPIIGQGKTSIRSGAWAVMAGGPA